MKKATYILLYIFPVIQKPNEKKIPCLKKYKKGNLQVQAKPYCSKNEMSCFIALCSITFCFDTVLFS